MVVVSWPTARGSRLLVCRCSPSSIVYVLYNMFALIILYFMYRSHSFEILYLWTSQLYVCSSLGERDYA